MWDFFMYLWHFVLQLATTNNYGLVCCVSRPQSGCVWVMGYLQQASLKFWWCLLPKLPYKGPGWGSIWCISWTWEIKAQTTSSSCIECQTSPKNLDLERCCHNSAIHSHNSALNSVMLHCSKLLSVINVVHCSKLLSGLLCCTCVQWWQILTNVVIVKLSLFKLCVYVASIVRSAVHNFSIFNVLNVL
jgi:hypothetical protein